MSLENLSLKKGEIAFLWFNSFSGVAIRTPSKTLVFDPAEVEPETFKKVDAVLITHDHFDHLDESIVRDIHKRTRCLVIADLTSAKKLRNAVASDKLREVRAGSELKIDNVAVRAEGFKHPAATPVSFLVTTEDGVKIYHTGDTLPFPEMKGIGEKSPPDIVFCTVGAPAPGASPKTGVEIVKMVKPKVAVPYHAPRADSTRFAELLSKEAPQVRCMIIRQGESYKYP
ncbi:MAG: metal-dependent hydrolase [Candidatus Bathyarchaeota archaeon BA2]|nr:MAG: metal-dependent hydrolase [Candidatus Bathyarchaeota archaeon BA2]